MTATTLVTLGTGRVLEVKGDYAAVSTALAPRQMSENGTRELTLAQGGQITIAREAVLTVEAAETAAKVPMGFGRELVTA
jgi:hypothetical protein